MLRAFLQQMTSDVLSIQRMRSAQLTVAHFHLLPQIGFISLH